MSDDVVFAFLSAACVEEGEIDDALADPWISGHPEHRVAVIDEFFGGTTSIPSNPAPVETPEGLALGASLGDEDKPSERHHQLRANPARRPKMAGKRPTPFTSVERQRHYSERHALRSLDIPEATYLELKRVGDSQDMSLDQTIRWLLQRAAFAEEANLETSPGDNKNESENIRRPVAMPVGRPKGSGQRKAPFTPVERQRRYRASKVLRSLDLPAGTHLDLKRVCDTHGMSIDDAIRWLLLMSSVG